MELKFENIDATEGLEIPIINENLDAEKPLEVHLEYHIPVEQREKTWGTHVNEFLDFLAMGERG